MNIGEGRNEGGTIWEGWKRDGRKQTVPRSLVPCTVCLRLAGLGMTKIPELIPGLTKPWILQRWREINFDYKRCERARNWRGQIRQLQETKVPKVVREKLSAAELDRRRKQRYERQKAERKNQGKSEFIPITEMKLRKLKRSLVGERFGELTVLGVAGRWSLGGDLAWRCKCDCGKETVVRGSSLTRGLTKSCRCRLFSKESPEHKWAKLKIRNMMRSTTRRIKAMGGRKRKSSLSYLGCSPAEFRIYVEAMFRDGMTWANHGTLWHFDHIMPLTKFDLSNQEHVKMAAHYTNIQPLLASENIAKRATVFAHQSALML